MCARTNHIRFMGYDVSFLKNIFLKSLLISCVVWGFMIVQFWWGDHDWGYLKNQVSLRDGFFEARYSQHLFTVLLFNGQVLPVWSIIGGIIFLTMTAVLLAVYLELPQQYKLFCIFVLFVCLNPYVFVFFYYVYLSVSFMVWPLVGVGGLLLCEKRSAVRFGLGCVIWFLLLGSYPPNIALILVAFCVKRTICYCWGKENLRDIIVVSFYFSSQLIFGFLGFKIVYFILEKNNLLNLDMYNIDMRGISGMLLHIPEEFLKSIGQLFDVQTFLGWDYCVLLVIPLSLAIWELYRIFSGKRLVLTLLVLSIFIASRFAFIAAERSEVGFFRMEYFGRLGLAVFALAILGRVNKLWVKNLYWLWGVLVLALFMIKNYEIQKIQFLGFYAGRQYQARLGERLATHPLFTLEQKYITFSFGYPNFRQHFLDDEYQTGEFAEKIMVFYSDIVTALFWEENVHPVAIGVGINGKSLLRVDRSNNGELWRNTDYWQDNPENIKNIRYWLYMEAKQNSVWVDDKYIILVLDMLDFYRHRELVLKKLDE